MKRAISHLLLDFDKTLTLQDTLHLVATAAYTHQNNRLGIAGTSPDALSAPDLPSWDHFTNAYLADQKSHTEQFGTRSDLQRELEYLASLKTVEQASVKRVEDSGLFRGVTDADIQAQAPKAEFRNPASFWKLACTVMRSGTKVSVISVTWSTVFVKETLRLSAKRDKDKAVEVWANDVVMGDDGTATGKLTKKEGEGIATGEDKLRILRTIVGCDESADTKSKTVEGLVVYVGDSVTDLHALLEADVGVVMGDDGSVKETCARTGIRLQKGLEGFIPKDENTARVLYRIEDWDELMTFFD